jgi:hypothetical protein
MGLPPPFLEAFCPTAAGLSDCQLNRSEINNLKKLILLTAGLMLGASMAGASSLTFTCDANVSAAVCATLNTTIAGLYTSTFNNLNASVYIQFGTTGLGSSTQGFTNQISYSTYLKDLAATASNSALDISALANLPNVEPAYLGGADVDLSTALGTALGVTGLTGTTFDGNTCNIGDAGCYNGIITITNDPNTPLYFRSGPQDPNSYDYYTTVEHELDEVLGSSSCIDTTGKGSALINGCANSAAAAIDLFRYASAHDPVLISTTPGAYFSYDGGVTNGANGFVYNTLVNAEDYADFLSSCPAGPLSVQDAEGCPGTMGLDITNDGGAEVNSLDAIGFNLAASSSVPEPGSIALFGAGIAALGMYRRLRRG